jgi:hypothetical protein
LSKEFWKSWFHYPLQFSSKIVLVTAGVVSLVSISGWIVTGKNYVSLGSNWLGIGGFGVGLYEGKIFWLSLAIFACTFAISYLLMFEGQGQNFWFSLLLSGLVTLSGAYMFELVYQYLIGELARYLLSIGFWFNLSAGIVAGFLLGAMRLNKVSLGFFASFAVIMIIWYFAGYPQLDHKEVLILKGPNYLGLPPSWSLGLNLLAKLFASLAVVMLLYGVARKTKRQAHITLAKSS